MSYKDRLAYYFMSSHPVDAARVMERQDEADIISLINDAPPAMAAENLRQMDDNVAAAILDRLETEQVIRIMECFPIRTMSVLLRRMALRENILGGLLQDLASDVRRVIQHPEGTTGALMDPRIFTVTADVKIGDLLETVQRHPEFIKDYLYIVSRDHMLVGVCSLNVILSGSREQAISMIMQPPQHPLSP
jgi:magnesium transporter